MAAAASSQTKDCKISQRAKRGKQKDKYQVRKSKGTHTPDSILKTSQDRDSLNQQACRTRVDVWQKKISAAEKHSVVTVSLWKLDRESKKSASASEIAGIIDCIVVAVFGRLYRTLLFCLLSPVGDVLMKLCCRVKKIKENKNTKVNAQPLSSVHRNAISDHLKSTGRKIKGINAKV